MSRGPAAHRQHVIHRDLRPSSPGKGRPWKVAPKMVAKARAESSAWTAVRVVRKPAPATRAPSAVMGSPGASMLRAASAALATRKETHSGNARRAAVAGCARRGRTLPAAGESISRGEGRVSVATGAETEALAARAGAATPSERTVAPDGPFHACAAARSMSLRVSDSAPQQSRDLAAGGRESELACTASTRLARAGLAGGHVSDARVSHPPSQCCEQRPGILASSSESRHVGTGKGQPRLPRGHPAEAPSKCPFPVLLQKKSTRSLRRSSPRRPRPRWARGARRSVAARSRRVLFVVVEMVYCRQVAPRREWTAPCAALASLLA